MVQTNASTAKVEIDRAGLPTEAADVVTLILKRLATKDWEEVGRCTVAGGVLTDKDGAPITTSSATFRTKLAAGTLLRVVAEAKDKEIPATIRLTWS